MLDGGGGGMLGWGKRLSKGPEVWKDQVPPGVMGRWSG